MAIIIRGNNNDQVAGTQADDLIIAAGGNDRVRANDGNDSISGGDGNDNIFAGDGDDISDGGAGNDNIRTDQGSDIVIGGLGNDTIEFLGGGGADILVGVDPKEGRGRGEIDLFKENAISARFNLRRDRETFILGDQKNAFYVGEGNNDFAQIQNFKPELDRIQLHGSAEQYTIGRLRGVGVSGTGLFFEGDLIAALEGIRPSDISLDSEIFVFPGDRDFVNEFPTVEAPEDNNPDVINELEINNSIRDAQDLGEVGQEELTIVGNVKSEERLRPDEDRFDLFKIEVTEPSQLNATLLSDDPDLVSVSVVRDFNNDGRSNFDDLIRPSASSGPDQISFDRLDPGTYFVRVSGKSGADVDYQLTFNAPPIETARLNLNLNELIPLDLDRNDPNPVRFEAEIGNQVFEQRFDETFERTTLTADIDVNQREIPIKVRAFRLNADGSETQFDIGLGPERGDLEFDATYDTLTRKLFKVGAFRSVNEGQTLREIARRDGADGRIALNVTFDTFSEGQPAPELPNIQSAASGTRKSETLRGTNANGIIDGKGGNDRVFTRGGDDIAIGGAGEDLLSGGSGDDTLIGDLGDDLLIGGAGDDLLNGGPGSDVLVGNAGSDIFVISEGQGRDSIRDFQNGTDFIGLSSGLLFEDLTIAQDGNRAIVSLADEQLAIVRGVRANQLNTEDFVAVGSTEFQGNTVPIVLPENAGALTV